MRIFKGVFNFYINSSCHVALSVLAMTWVTIDCQDLSIDANVLSFVFFATFTAYNFVKYFGLAKFHHRSLAHWLKLIQVFNAIAFVFMCYYMIQLSRDVLYLIIGLAFITFLYAIPLIPKRFIVDEQQNLRQIGGIKVYIIALVWSLVTVAIPVLNANVTFDYEIWITLFQRFLFVFVLMLPFEIRDLNYDSLKLSTIPQKFGIKKTKIIGILVLIIFIILEFLKRKTEINSVVSILLIAIITLLFLLLSKKNQPKYYSSFWVEAIPIFWLILILLF